MHAFDRNHSRTRSPLSLPKRPASVARSLARVGTIAAALAGIGVGALGLNSCSQYQDFPGFSEDASQGRTKNAIATVVAGLVAEKITPNATINLEVEKFWYPDAHIEGSVHNGTIYTHMPLAFTSATLRAEETGGLIVGTIEKSEFNWDLKQTGPDTWQLGRALLKFDHSLQLSVRDGHISGELARTMGFNWSIDGTYSPDGHVEIRIDGPMTLGMTLRGTVTESR